GPGCVGRAGLSRGRNEQGSRALRAFEALCSCGGARLTSSWRPGQPMENQAMPQFQCPDCQLPMEIGYIPDRGDSAVVTQSAWHSSLPEPSRLLGMKTGSVRPTDGSDPIPIWSFRCPNCGLLRLHAIPA